MKCNIGENKEYHPCDKEKGFCKTLEDRIKNPDEGGSGFFELITFDFTKPQCCEKVQGAMYKTKRSDRGVMLNFCPFCGKEIRWWKKNKETTDAE